MKKTIILLFLTIFIFLGNSFSQTKPVFQVIGEVSDTTTGLIVEDGTLTVETLYPDSSDGSMYYEKFRISNGEFNIELEEGEYYFSIYADGYETLYNQYVFINSDTTMSLHLNKLVVYKNLISGKIIDKESKEGILFPYLILSGLDSSQVYFSKSEEDGGFKFENIVPGDYVISLKSFGYKKYESQNITITENTILTDYIIEMEASERYSNIKFNIYETVGNHLAPIENAVVYLSNADWLMMSSRHPYLTENGDTIYSDGYYKSLTDNQGVAVFNDVVAYEYYIEVNKEGYERINYDVQFVTVDSDDIEINIEMKKLPEPAIGYITGTVKTEETQEPLVAYVEFYKMYSDNSDSSEVIEPVQFYYTSVLTNKDGEYKAKLDTGKYKIRCYYYDEMYTYKYLNDNGFAANFIEEYYNNAKTLDDAEIITVAKDQHIENISFSLDYKIPTTKTVTIKGKVTDENNHPLDNAMVTFNNNYYMLYNNFAYTDLDGKYEMNLKVIDSYDEEIRISATKEGYTRMFYDNKAAWYLADPVLIKKSENDTTIADINFTIDKLENLATYTLTGTVTDTSSKPLNGIYVDAYGLDVNKYYSTTTDSLGNYAFNELIEGSYVVSFFGENYAYEFYNDQKIWEDAEVLIVNSDFTNIDAQLETQDYIECYDLKRNDTGIQGVVADVNGNPIAGASVNLTADNTSANLSTVTNSEGNYSFNSLKQNSYTLTVSKVDFQSVTEKVDLTNSNSKSVNLKLLKSYTNIEPISNDIPDSYKLYDNYPNPFNPSTNIEFELPEDTKVQLTVYNVLGEEIKVLVNRKLEAGKYKYSFVANDLTSGVYFFTLNTDNFKLTKKMLLIK